MVYFVCLFLTSVFAQTPYEGWFRVERNRRHIGYVLQRLSLDPQTRAKNLVTYTRTKQDKSDFFEITLATADPDFHARHATFLTNKDAVPYQIVSEFRRGSVLSRKVAYPSLKPLSESQDHGADVVGAFLLFAADLPRLGINVEYTFHAYAEERARVAYGTFAKLAQKKAEGITVDQLGIDYLGQYMESFTAEDGTPLGARNLAEGTVVFWVSNRKLAVGDLPFTPDEVVKRFGSVPDLSRGPWGAIKDTQLTMQSFAPPPRRLPGSPAQPPPALPLRSR